MNKKQIMATAICFGVICLSGLLVGFASGVHWGTSDCGFIAACTLLMAIVLSPAASAFAE